jgi:CO/xanthine dehydrogenase FAD-binding subunit
MLPRFGYHRPATLDEAVSLLKNLGAEAGVLAGGTDLLVGLGDGSRSAGHLIDIKGIADLSNIAVQGDHLMIGAGVSVNRLLEFRDLPKPLGALREAAGRLATHQIRNRATVVGNICNASPACDMGPPLLVLDAELTAVSPEGERRIPIGDFFRGVKVTCCKPAEIVTAITIPVGGHSASVFHKRTRIRGHDLSLVNGAAALGKTGRLKLALGAVAATPVLLSDFDGWVLDRKPEIEERVIAAIKPIDDVRSSGTYRLAMARFVVGELLARLKDAGEAGA